jgi:hypothetical protein
MEMDRTTRASRIAILLLAGLSAAALVGCDKPQVRKTIVLNPTTRQTPTATQVAAIVQPATLPAATQVVKKISQMQIGRLVAEFPEARLIIHKNGEKLTAFLVSNDPPEVLNPNYQGNRYSFEMTLDSITDFKDIAQADFVYKAASQEIGDSPNGIFLNGDRQHLQPYDIRVVFSTQGDHLIADLRGTFINSTGEWIPVMAQIAAKPEMK